MACSRPASGNARGGQIVPPQLRNPTTAEIAACRGRAERILEQYGQGTIAEATPDILESARSSAKAAILREIAQVQTTVTPRTRAWPTIWYGVAAWFTSIFITVVITFAAPGWVTNLVNRISPTEQVAPKPNRG
jgi:hypothetical protein